MRISHRYKFVYIAIPKTGSTSVRHSLDEYSDICGVRNKTSPYHWHIKAKDLKKHFKNKGWNWDEYFKFTFVRNPWDRLISNWNYKKKSKHIWEKYKKGSYKHYLECGELFKKFENLRHYARSTSFLSCYEWIYDEKRNNLLDFIGKFENIQEDFDIICDKIGIQQRELPHENKTKHKSCKEYYDDETREIVAKKYAKDIEYFGYEFGE